MCHCTIGRIAYEMFNTLRLRQNGHHLEDDTVKFIYLRENCFLSIQILLKCILDGPVNNAVVAVQIMTWPWTGDKPLTELMMKKFIDAHMQVGLQWVNPYK